ncbi:alpha/beta hydrolase [Draconibacterium sp. IB214405]|uniref:alpha/beta fold hydrolase n=1 Tax=Draconibacterium sp. IB214405 TaxID=3097352 RepID=UPI002A106156|nr:alpha/beta hydrolase [Draconibacterium sp. IB214405]MDX8339176.1 alpha/beta hydrolase [Draconibacterium sp. IB214405]
MINPTLKRIVLLVAILIPLQLLAQIPYGNNTKTGKYIQTKDAKIYYEIYGSGEPLLLIHGSLYGYINEFENIFPLLTKNHKVIAVALRGHGKSEIGDRDYSYDLFAQDMIEVLSAENIDRIDVMGFSSGAITAVKLAADYPERVVKVVSIAGALNATDKTPERKQQQKEMTADEFIANNKNFVENRKKLMPEPNRYNDFYNKLMKVDSDPIWISEEAASEIKAPVLVVGGDRDGYFPVEAFLKMYAVIPDSKLLILPGDGHVGASQNKAMYVDFAIPFLDAN